MSESENGMVSIKSENDFETTLTKLESIIVAKELILFAKVDHAAGASKVGKQLRPTTLLIFGSPKAGTPLMEAEQKIGLDLPLKVLVWEDEAQQVWLTYNDIDYLAKRHALGDEVEATVTLLANVLDAFTKHAAKT